MSIEIRVPSLGESVTEATVGQWFKKPGEPVKVDEPLVELETDKVTVEVPAPSEGVMGEIITAQGDTVEVGALLGILTEGQSSKAASPAGKPAQSAPPKSAPSSKAAPPKPAPQETPRNTESPMPPSPAARKALAEAGIAASDVEGSGRRGQILKHDVPRREAPAPSYVPVAVPEPQPQQRMRVPTAPVDETLEQRVKMTRLRQTIARRLKDAQNTAAMLTTFNDVDMSAVMAIRSQYKELFESRHGIKLGFMGFFVKACIQALKEIPSVNAEIDGEDLIYKNYYHIGVAVGTDRGLVVPIVRDADRLSLAEIEKQIVDYGQRARKGQLGIEELQGGTFTITNGGVYGSLMSTPILNAPQSGILGMHRIEQRPVVLKDGSIAARPMMYLALTYDHRIVDGKEAVTFLVRVKECLEDPHRFILDL